VAKQIRLNLGGQPSSFDPAFSGVDRYSTQCSRLLFLGLTDYDEETLETIPALATEWHVSDDGLTWTFAMRRDAEWVRYDPVTRQVTPQGAVTAHDVVYSIRRALDPATEAVGAYADYVIKNAEAVNYGEDEDLESIGVRAVDDYTVEFTLEHPTVYFPGLLASQVNRIVPQQAIEEYGERWTEPGNIWTNGPYLLDAWNRGSKLVMRKNPLYYGAQTVDIELINWYIVDPNTELAMYESGELDVAFPDEAMIKRLKADPGRSNELDFVPQLNIYYVGFNTRKAPFDNAQVRRAFAMAIDRQGIVKAFISGDMAATSFTPPGLSGSPADDPSFKGIPYDPKGAKQLLAEAGFPGGKGLPEIVLGISAGQSAGTIAELLQRNLKDNLGVQLRVVSQEWDAFMQTLRDDPPQLFYSGRFFDLPDAQDAMLSFHPAKGPNRAGWDADSPSAVMFAALVDKAGASSDPALRKSYYLAAERILVEEQAIVVPLYYETAVYCTKLNIQRTFSRNGVERIDRWAFGVKRQAPATPGPTPTPTLLTGQIEVVIREYSYSQWGRPAGMDDPKKPCGDFDDRRPVRKLTASLTVYNKSSQSMKRWTAIFVKPNGKRAYTCIQGYETLPAIPPGGSLQVTFSAFIESNEKVAYGVIQDTVLGLSNELAFR